ncbi:hypothetical protein [Phytohalomonas tamaricis]|uniref:hypothetical protein n=1 Tax=Phytohalomonas tamaricis TaxID=2081032 RepID=UPI000D0B6497|nr:hypothetical protein [Phytohalomonas tamaricis]
MIIRWESDHDYVLVHVHQDMFGDWIVSRAWGQIGTQFGGLKHMLAEDFSQAMTWVEDIDHIQISRGFTKVLSTSIDTPEAKEAMRQLSLLEQS